MYKEYTAHIVGFKKNGFQSNPTDHEEVKGSKTVILNHINDFLKNSDNYRNITVTIK